MIQFRLIILFFSIIHLAAGQVPQGIPYQAVARNAQGLIMANKPIKVRFSIIDSLINGPVVYTETQEPITSTSGLFTTNIGMGNSNPFPFEQIKWGRNLKFLKVEIDTTASGNNYIDLGTQQMMSVPYVLFSENGMPGGGSEGQLLTFCDGLLRWTDGGVCPAKVSGLNCSVANIPISFYQGIYSLCYPGIPYTGGNCGYYPAQSIQSYGVYGLTAFISPGQLKCGDGILNFTITGSPSSSGTALFDITLGAQQCILSIPISIGLTGNSNASCGDSGIHNSTLIYGNVMDINGNSYRTVVIGSQEWMAENLKASHYSNGEAIPLVLNDPNWPLLNTGASCWYNNDSTNYDCPYGKLYNWYVIADSRGVCPSGWHIPYDFEWDTLLYRVFSGNWSDPLRSAYLNNSGGNMVNSSGFSALSGGYRYPGSNIFWNLNYGGYWWTATEESSTSAYFRGLASPNLSRSIFTKNAGFSIRCVKN